jgi:hypothetical protein
VIYTSIRPERRRALAATLRELKSNGRRRKRHKKAMRAALRRQRPETKEM